MKPVRSDHRTVKTAAINREAPDFQAAAVRCTYDEAGYT
jgi:hypothetical protein